MDTDPLPNLSPPPPASQSRAARQQQKTQRVGVEPLRLFMTRHAIHAADMSRRLYQSDTVVSQWIGDGTMPQWVLLALEAFDRRNGSAAVWIVRPGHQADALRIVLKSMGVEPVDLS